MSLIGDDCFFFYNSTCNKGPGCPFRHVEEAKANDVACPDWLMGKCPKVSCPLRHADLPKSRQAVPCYYETQVTGCTKPYCPFLHKFPKPGGPPHPVPATLGQPVVSAGQPIVPPPGWPPNVRPPVMRGPPPHGHPPPVNQWPPPHSGPPPGLRGLPPGIRGPPPPVSGPPYPIPMNRPPEYARFHHPPPGPPFPMMRPVEPVIINLNSEESDQDSIKGSPMKGRMIVPPQQTNPGRVDNPLDYFLNAKPWVNHGYRRSPSPPRYNRWRNTPSPRPISRSPSPGARSPRRSMSPRGRSPRRSMSPGSRSPRRLSISPVSSYRRRSISPVLSHRRRSVSVDRGPVRRRSNSLDRSRSISPDWKDKRRFNRRSPSPRRRSKSPVRNRGRQQDLRSRLKPPVSQAPKFEEIKVSGRKIVSLKKDKKEEEEEKKEEVEKTEETSATVVNEEVKSLEDIYRERALKSMMEAKRKRIIDQKKKRWETVKKTSESEKSDEGSAQAPKGTEKGDKDKSGNGKGPEEVEKEEKVEEVEEEVEAEASSSDSPEEGSDIDLADDVDIELDAGDLESFEEEEGDGDKVEESASEHEEEVEEKKANKTEKRKKMRSSTSSGTVKTSIKSRLGLKAIKDVTKQVERERRGNVAQRARSVKERLGLRSDSPIENMDRPLRSGVIKLSKGRPNTGNPEVRITRNLGGLTSKYGARKDKVVLPRITIHNRVEDRKNSIKKRLGLLGDDDDDEGKKKSKWKEIDEELTLLLQEEDVDIDISDLSLLSKKEKKKLLKKLLTSQGREDDYDYFMRKKRKKTKRREREFEEEEEEEEEELEEGRGRKINIKSKSGPSPNPDDWSQDADEEDLQSEEEIELAEDVPEEFNSLDKTESPKKENVEVRTDPSPSKEDNLPVKSRDELRREKEARLKRELAPISLEEIRKKRALKRIHAGGDAENNKHTDTEMVHRTLSPDEASDEGEKKDPPVRVTFKGDFGMKRRLTRLGDDLTKNENTMPPANKAFKRERQIYVPPTSKKEVEKRLNPVGREVINYGEMFSKKPEPQEETTVKKITAVKPVTFDATDALQTRKPLRLNRGPPKVEVKDATVKTFAEIMAEKKRKRLLAQQAEGTAKKPYTPFAPILFEDSGSKPERSMDVKSRLSPTVETSTGNKTSPVNTPHSEQFSVTKSTTVSNINKTVISAVPDNSNIGAKTSRWKRRKTNPDLSLEASVTKMGSVPAIVQSVDNKDLSSQSVGEDLLLEERVESTLLMSPTPVISRSLSSSSDKNKRSSPEEKTTKLSDSLLDIDDDLLMDDNDDLDLDLANTQDHDELMREIDELLA